MKFFKKLIILCFLMSALIPTSDAAENIKFLENTKKMKQNTAASEFEHAQLEFDFISSDGAYWYDCKHIKETQPHSWTVICDRFVFKLHLLLKQYIRADESTYEFHYWADAVEGMKETHTQSTWLTVDRSAKPKKIVGYLGFANDASQLRIELRP